MANVLDVAKYILEIQGKMTAMKLQKLVYYSQAWSLVWDGRPLFPEEIQAWANGPVCPDLYKVHRGKFLVDVSLLPKADSGNLDKDGRETVDAVLEGYGDKEPNWLSRLTHKELPWSDARTGLRISERGTRIITHAAMAEYYESLF